MMSMGKVIFVCLTILGFLYSLTYSLIGRAVIGFGMAISFNKNDRIFRHSHPYSPTWQRMAVFYFLKEFGKFRIIILYFPLGDKFRVVVELMVDLDYHFHSALSFRGSP